MTRLERRAVMVGILLTMGAPGGRDLEAQRARLVKIGALTESWGPTTTIVGLRDGLQERGYRENKDFVIGVRFTQGSSSELPQAARDLVAHGVDVIVATGRGPEAKAAQMATSQIPVVFVVASDPVAAGLVKSFARPGGNLTGIADLGFDLVPKRMEIFRELVPRLRRILLVYDATNAEAIETAGGASRRRPPPRPHARGATGANGGGGPRRHQRGPEERGGRPLRPPLPHAEHSRAPHGARAPAGDADHVFRLVLCGPDRTGQLRGEQL